MKNMTLLVGGQKGGCGKTTLAVSLAIMRKRAGRDVVLVDTDEQASARDWVQTRSKLENVDGRVPVFHFADLGRGLRDAIVDLKGRCQDIVIDVAGFKSEEFVAALTVADRVITPIRSSTFDLKTMKEVNRLVGITKSINPALDATWLSVMVTTHATAKYKSLEKAKTVLEELTNLRGLDCFIHHRAAYEALADGLLLDEQPKSDSQEKGVIELKRLYQEAWREGVPNE